MTDDIGAFVPGPRVRIEGRAGGPLAGLTFAAKDLFDVAGVPTGGGNHDWPTGRPIPAFDVRADEVMAVEQVLRQAQAKGKLGTFSPRVIAASMKAVLDDLLIQFTDDPSLDIETYGKELVALFERATKLDMHQVEE